MYPKARDTDFPGRFREIVSDPLNFAIERDPRSGYIDEKGKVFLHNGIKVPVAGPHAYYGQFSAILVINRGVHEPLEEYLFQEVLKTLPASPVMLELGAYWGHYSMWLQSRIRDAELHLVEPEKVNFESGIQNFKENGFKGKFTNAFVGKGQFSVDQYMAMHSIPKLDILHSDIQGYEVEMLEDCKNTLANKAVDRIFVSTHSDRLHQAVTDILNQHGYRVEVSSDVGRESTSCDGLVYATSPNIEPTFEDLNPLGRTDIVECQPRQIAEYLDRITSQERG